MTDANPHATAQDRLVERTAAALDLDVDRGVELVGPATLDSGYPVSELAAASVAAVARATAGVLEATGGASGAITVDRPLADAWFGLVLAPVGWELPSPWDPIAGDYRADDGWIRLHTNAPHHRTAALRVLGTGADREQVAAAVAGWGGEELERRIVEEGGCAAVLRPPAAWAAHPQGAAVAAEPLVATERTERTERAERTEPGAARSTWSPSPDRPLRGLRVLDLTRVLAGPAATRVLAGLGADVLRIDPPGWDEPAIVPDMTLGKRAARLDARDPAGLERLRRLLAEADVLVHGYRADALERLGLGEAARRELRPGLVDVSLDAYGFTGPWATRRGFDSLVQMSSGIAWAGEDAAPRPLPVQALDQATGWLAAAAVLAGLAARARDGRGTRARLSLARTAVELQDAASSPRDAAEPAPPATRIPVDTPWGPATRPPAPFTVGAVTLDWARPPRPLGSDAPMW